MKPFAARASARPLTAPSTVAVPQSYFKFELQRSGEFSTGTSGEISTGIDMSWSGERGQAAARFLRRLSPLSSMRCASWTTRSRMASARVGFPMISYQRSIGTWLVMISEPEL